MWDRVEIHGPFIMQKNEGGGIPMAGRKPTCPDWLMPEAKKEWERLAELMNQMGVLTEVDIHRI